MSRRDEVKKEWLNIYENYPRFEMEPYRSYALTLADEVDARDAINDKLLAMLEPGEEHPKWGHGICESCGWHGCFSSFVGRAGGELQDDDESLCPVCEDTVQDVDRSIYVNLHARACEIAGRVKA